MDVREVFGMCEDANIFSHSCHPEKEVLLEWSIKTNQYVSNYSTIEVSVKYEDRAGVSNFIPLLIESYDQPEHLSNGHKCLPKNRCMLLHIQFWSRESLNFSQVPDAGYQFTLDVVLIAEHNAEGAPHQPGVYFGNCDFL